MATTVTPVPTGNGTGTDDTPGSLITLDGQIQWGDLLMGTGTPYPVDRSGVTGWDDLPELDLGDVLRPDQHGSWPGDRWAQPRLVGATVWLAPPAGTDPLATASAFRAATGPDGQERWLAVRLLGETLAVRARVSRRVVPQDRSYAVAGFAKVSLQWTATDPRRYAPALHEALTGLPVAEAGLVWEDAAGSGLSWPLDWGGTGAAGSIAAVNAGGAAVRPVVEFRGPVQRPSLTRLSDGRQLQYDLALGPGDLLTVDTEAGTVLLNGTASRIYTATPDSSPEQLFSLEPGTTDLAFRSDDVTPSAAASVTVRWRDAHW
ncbi:phage distal tail protein [Streptomyces sp. CRN 30]|uniref:phage distal tail protein n=1 Tax=Streptomyces sp. CRN 30 TaxID=3075613 RepID=UPI002A82CF6A|nr:phage tail domain-containing protein [Streptomyces sp. CRN 30]